MDEKRLTELLHHTDPPAAPCPTLSGATIRRAARRRLLRRRIAATSAAVLLCALATLIVSLRRPTTEHRDGPVAGIGSGGGPVNADILDIPTRIQLEAQAQLDHKRLLARIAELKPMDPAEARADAARTMVLLAPRRGEFAGMQEATTLYRRAIALFPDTPSAAVARDALAKLQ